MPRKLQVRAAPSALAKPIVAQGAPLRPLAPSRPSSQEPPSRERLGVGWGATRPPHGAREAGTSPGPHRAESPLRERDEFIPVATSEPRIPTPQNTALQKSPGDAVRKMKGRTVHTVTFYVKLKKIISNRNTEDFFFPRSKRFANSTSGEKI